MPTRRLKSLLLKVSVFEIKVLTWEFLRIRSDCCQDALKIAEYRAYLMKYS